LQQQQQLAATGKQGSIHTMRAVLSCLAVVAVLCSVTAQQEVRITEIHYDNAGTDTGESIEVTGPGGTDLTGYSIELYNGNGGASYDTKALTGTLPPASAGSVLSALAFTYPTDGIQVSIMLLFIVLL
jgi:uncharacterized protein